MMNFLKFPQKIPVLAFRGITTISSSTSDTSPANIKTSLDNRSIRYGDGYVSYKFSCPFCSRQSPRGKTETVHVNKTTGQFTCSPCGVQAVWLQFIEWLKEVSRSPNMVPEGVLSQKREGLSDQATPSPAWTSSVPWSDASSGEKTEVINCFKLENIKEEMFNKYSVRLTKSQFPTVQGSLEDMPCVVYPWYSGGCGREGVVFRCKVETIAPPSDRQVLLDPRHGHYGMFGWNVVKETDQQLVITSHETAAMAVHQSTGLPVVTLPMGLATLPPELLPRLEQFDRVILWFDGDVHSRQTASQFARKLHLNRCYLVRSLDESYSSKFGSAVDAMNKGLDLNKIIQDARPFSHNRILNFQQLRDDVYSELADVDHVAGTKWKRFPGLTSILKGHRLGELSIFTGPTGSGKTTVMSELSLDLCSQGVATLWGSFEIKNVRLAKIMMRQLSGMNLEKHLDKFHFWADKMEHIPMYFMSFHGAEDIFTVIEAMSHAAYVYDIRHVIIDNLQFMTGSTLNFADRFTIQNQAIAEFRKFASSRNVHVTVVIHPRKEDDNIELQTASIFGTAKASQESDNILILQRPPGRGKYLQVTKNRFDGDLGKIQLSFDYESLTLSGMYKAKESIDTAPERSKVTPSTPKLGSRWKSLGSTLKGVATQPSADSATPPTAEGFSGDRQQFSFAVKQPSLRSNSRYKGNSLAVNQTNSVSPTTVATGVVRTIEEEVEEMIELLDEDD